MHHSTPLKLMLPLYGVSLLLLMLGLLAAWNVHEQQFRVSELVARDAHATVLIHDLYIQMREARHLLNQYLRFGDESYLEGVQALQDETERLLRESRALAHDPEQQTRLAQVEEGYREFVQQLRSARPLPPAERSALLQSLADDRINTLVLEPANECVEMNTRVIDRANERNRATAATVTNGLLFLGFCGSLAGVMGGLALSRGLRRSLLELHVSVSGTVDKLETVVGPFPTSDSTVSLQEGMLEIRRRVEHVVTQLHERERELLHNQQLAAMGRLAAALAHEMRNPLTPVKMLVQMAHDREEGLTARELEIIISEISRLERSIQSFMDFARPPRLERRCSDLRDTTALAIELVMGRCRTQAIDLSTDFPAGPCEVDHDTTQIRQVILNLLLNALDALPPHGHLRVSIRRQPAVPATADQPRQPAGIWIRVIDNGPGIPTTELERIFEPFATSKESGTGLGLAISRRIVEAHDGQITASSSPGQGATFSIWLPQSESEPASAPAATS